MSLTGLRTRSHTVAALRQSLLSRGFEEIILTLMNGSQPTEPAIYPFKAGNNYLATSPESCLKKAMAAGIGKCFAIGPAFRDLEQVGPLHQPEFLMAEWYLPDTDWQTMMQLTQEIITDIAAPLIPSAYRRKPWPRVSWVDLWRQYLGQDLAALTVDGRLEALAAKKGYSIKDATWEQLFHQLVLNEIEPRFPKYPFFLVDFPARISPLAKPRKDMPALAERFELIINGTELVNGNTESFNTNAIRSMMTDELKRRSLSQPVDESFLAAIHALTGQQWVGVGLGVDRLAMMLGKHQSVKELQVAQ